jgi:hypothetical protein
MSEPICLRPGCGESAKNLSVRIKAGIKFCSLKCAAQWALDNSMDMYWCKKHGRWEDEISYCGREVPSVAILDNENWALDPDEEEYEDA